MEDSIGECIYLLPKRTKTSFLGRIKQAWKNTPIELKMGISLLVLLTITATLIYVNLSSSEVEFNEIIHQSEINMTALDPSDRRFLLAELKTQNPKIMNLRELLILLQGNTPQEKEKLWLGISMKDTDSDILIICALLLESLKLALKKCMNTNVLPRKCQKLIHKKIQCSPSSKYRTIDGSCNNLDHPTWGMGSSANGRWLQAAFSDDVSLPRVSVTGTPLPNARHLSSVLFSHRTRPESNITMLFAYFGLFIDHDMVRAGQTKGSLNKCCEKDFYDPACLPIDVAPQDYFYGHFNVKCLGFLRNVPSIGKCPGRREQKNLMTSFLDSSDTYGPTIKESRELRSFKNGKLRVSIFNNTVLLPVRESAGNSCYSGQAQHQCFSSGDIRTNMLLPLMVLHTIWAREHNRLADELQKINPKWNDEKLFQEARRILIAELQYITYKEFLPLIFGSNSKMKEYGILIEEDEIYDDYDPTEDPTLRSAFSTAAFRFGHTLVQNKLYFVDEDYKIQNKIPLHETYMNPDALYDHNLDSVLRGMVSLNTHQVEPYTTEEIRGHLLQHFYQTYGLDLTSITIQRGRDHGLPPYLEWRKFCNLPTANSWEDLKSILPGEYVEELKTFYQSVEDIDLMAGGLGEKPVDNALTGPTYQCLFGKQFRALRVGDRFWFEDPNQPGSFTRNQLKEIYKVSTARFLCNTSDDLKSIPRYSFLKTSEENPIVRCDDLPQMNLTYWKE